MATGGGQSDAGRDGGHTCEPCRSEGKTRLADVHCVTCGQYQCADCSKVHTLYQYMFGHDIHPLAGRHASSTITSGSDIDCVNFASFINELEICPLHQGTIEVICCSHNALCCSTCIVEEHPTCTDRRGLMQHIGQTSFDTRNVDSKIYALKHKLQDIKRKLTNTIKSIDKTFVSSQQCLNKAKLLSNDKFDALDQSIQSEMTRKKQTFDVEFTMKESELQHVYGKQQATCSRYRRIVSRGTTLDCFKAFHAFHNDNEMYEVLIDMKEKEMYIIDITMKVNHILRNVQKCPKQFVVHHHKDTNTEPNIIYRRTRDGTAVVQPLVLSLTQSVDLTPVLNTAKAVQLYGVAFLSDDRIVAVDNANKLVLLLRMDLTVIEKFELDYHPTDLAVISATDVVVAYDGGFSSTPLIILTISRNNTISIRRKLKTYQQHDCIRVLDDQMLIAGSSTRRTTAEKVNMYSATITAFSKYVPQKEFKWGEATATLEYLASKKLLVVAHMLKDKIEFWPIDDSASVKTVTNDCIKTPRGMCVGPMDCVFVCCYGTNKVVQITHEGQLVCCYYLEKLNYPMAVSISKDETKMVVTSNLVGKSIGVFSLNKLV